MEGIHENQSGAFVTKEHPVPDNRREADVARGELPEHLQSAAHTIALLSRIDIYDRAGRTIFSGAPAEFRERCYREGFGSWEELGGIQGPDKKSIIRFGARDGDGFVDRMYADVIFHRIATYIREADDGTKLQELEQKMAGSTEGPDVVEAGEKGAGLSDGEMKGLTQEAGEFIRTYEPEVFGVLKADRYDGIEMKIARDGVNPEVGRRFQAHGIAKGSIGSQLRSLNELLTHGIDPERPFYTTELRMTDEDEELAAGAVGASGPYDTGSFIVISHPDKPIKDGIAGVVVNEHFYDAIPVLQKKFPGVKFIKASELPIAVEALTRP